MLCCRAIVTGKPLPLLSKFRLSYYTLLNILRRLEGSGQSMEYVIARSFQQFQFEQSLPQVRLRSRLIQEVQFIKSGSEAELASSITSLAALRADSPDSVDASSAWQGALLPIPSGQRDMLSCLCR